SDRGSRRLGRVPHGKGLGGCRLQQACPDLANDSPPAEPRPTEPTAQVAQIQGDRVLAAHCYWPASSRKTPSTARRKDFHRASASLDACRPSPDRAYTRRRRPPTT